MKIISESPWKMLKLVPLPFSIFRIPCLNWKFCIGYISVFQGKFILSEKALIRLWFKSCFTALFYCLELFDLLHWIRLKKLCSLRIWLWRWYLFSFTTRVKQAINRIFFCYQVHIHTALYRLYIWKGFRTHTNTFL